MGTILNFTVTGYVGGEPQVASFSVAVNRKTSGGKKQTLWIRVNCWNRLADAATHHIRKGSLVQFSAEWLRPSSWIANNGTPQTSLDVDANRLVVLDRAEVGAVTLNGGRILREKLQFQMLKMNMSIELVNAFNIHSRLRRSINAGHIPTRCSASCLI